MRRIQGILALLLLLLAGPVLGALQTLQHADLAQGRIPPAAIELAEWQNVPLDDPWRRQKPCREGEWTYRLPFEIDDPEREAYGLLIHRAGNRLHIWLNDHRIAAYGDLDNPDTDYSNAPLYTQLPTSNLHSGHNQLIIQVGGDCRRFSGLSQLEIGPHQVLEARWQHTYNLILWQNAAVVSICTTLALISLGIALWRRSPQALLFAITTGLWAIRCMLWGMTELPLPYEIWFFLIDFTYGVWMLAVCLLSMDISGIHNRWLRRFFWFTLILFGLTSIATALGAPTFWKALGLRSTIISCTAALIAVCHTAWRRPTANNLAIGIAGALMILIALIDHWNIWVSTAADAYHRLYLSPAAVLAFITSLGVILIRRFDTALKSETRYRQSLEQEVTRQRAEIEQSYKEVEDQVRQEAIEQERQRIVREMHDGLGAQLVGMLSTVRSTSAHTASLERDIQEALDQLRYTMDTMTTDGTDLTTLLGQFRYHNETRILQAGIQLHWHVTPLPSEHWPPQSLIHFERILREIFANILKHAQANLVEVATERQDGQCHIRITDNGKGFDPGTQPSGRGLRHLRERARELGIALDIHSHPGQGTRIHLHWADQPATQKTQN